MEKIDYSIFKALSDDNLDIVQVIQIVSTRSENIVGKEKSPAKGKQRGC